MIFVYMFIVSIRSYRRYPERPCLYYIAYIGFFLLGMTILSLHDYISEPGEIQLKVATIAFEWSLLLISLASAFFVLYLYRLNGPPKWGLAYLYAMCFAAVWVEFFHYPWIVEWKNGIGYVHNIGNAFLAYFFAQVICMLVIILQTINNVEKHVQIEKKTAQENKSIPEVVMKKIHKKLRNLKFIRYCYLLRITFGLITMIPGVYDMDYYAIIIINLPQMIILYRDRHIMTLTKSSLKSVYFLKNSGMILLDWNPGGPFEVNPSILLVLLVEY